MLVLHLIFVLVLLVNTYFSVRFFKFLPRTSQQIGIDIGLLALYCLLILYVRENMGQFEFAATALFVLATIKYALLLGTTPYDKVLRKKILIDIAGTALCLSALGITLLGYPLVSAWYLAIIFAAANVYLLALKPMYRL